jgi:hypothetical protein
MSIERAAPPESTPLTNPAEHDWFALAKFPQIQSLPLSTGACPLAHDCGNWNPLERLSLTAPPLPPSLRPLPAMAFVTVRPLRWTTVCCCRRA